MLKGWCGLASSFGAQMLVRASPLRRLLSKRCGLAVRIGHGLAARTGLFSTKVVSKPCGLAAKIASPTQCGMASCFHALRAGVACTSFCAQLQAMRAGSPGPQIPMQVTLVLKTRCGLPARTALVLKARCGLSAPLAAGCQPALLGHSLKTALVLKAWCGLPARGRCGLPACTTSKQL